MAALSVPPAKPAPPLPRGRLPGLDILRGIAALWVLAYHMTTVLGVDLVPVSKGYLSVDFFFVLSGYVMARTYEHRFAGGYGTWAFIAARYRRLWPTMAIGALIGAPMLALDLADPARFAAVALANVMLIPVFLGSGSVFPVNSVAWSVFAELWANVAHGLVLRRLRTRHLIGVAALLWLLLAARCITKGHLDSGAGDASLHIGVLRAVFGYGVGVVLWRWWRDRPTWPISPAAAFLAIPVLALATPLLDIGGWGFDLAFVTLAGPLLIAGGLRHRGGETAGKWLGGLSFPLYAVHLPILYWSKGLGLPPLAGIAAALALAAWLAWRAMGPDPRKRPAAAPENAGLPAASG